MPPTTTTGPRVALATCAEEPGLDEEGRLLLTALGAAGVDAVPAVWDDPAVDWAGFALVVVRSTWDYPRRRGEFLAWVDHVAEVGRLLNEPGLLRWTTDKVYLRALAEAGAPVVPSVSSVPTRTTSTRCSARRTW